jgi:Sap, sulfolipid-1-addressing protein
MNLLTVLPLAVVMIAGPQVISAIFLATSRDPRRSSVAYLLGAGLAMIVGLTVWYLVFHTIRAGAGGADRNGGSRRLISWIVLALLLILMVVVFIRRKRNEPPRWMRRLQDARPRFAFGLGVLLFLVMPSDEATMAAVAGSLAGQNRPWWHILPFTIVTVLLLALPLLTLLVFGQRATRALPKVRDWANANSWLVSEFVLVIFVVIVASGLS